LDVVDYTSGKKMDASKRKMIEGWKRKAENNLDMARSQLKLYHYSESIQASQLCIELAVKAILCLLEIKFPASHEWKPDSKSFDQIAIQIHDRKLIEKLAPYNYAVRLPRLLFLLNFWAQFYLTVKYGYEKGYLASAQEIFVISEDAQLAIKHAEECHYAVNYLFNLNEDQLAKIMDDVN
jgi:HEPN domain-containing protein